MKPRASRAAVALSLLLAACAGRVPPPAQPLPPEPVVVVTAAKPVAPPAVAIPAYPVSDAIPEAQASAVLDALQADLARRLQARANASASVTRSSAGAPLVALFADSTFEVESAQMRAPTLLLLADCAYAAHAAGAFVVHVLGYAGTAEDADLAERRAATITSYLISQGLPASRVRTEARVTAGTPRRIEIVFEPIVAGREVRAWMPP